MNDHLMLSDGYLCDEERGALQLLADSPGGIRLPGPALAPVTEEEQRTVDMYHLAILGLAERSGFRGQTSFCYTLTERGRTETQRLRGRP